MRRDYQSASSLTTFAKCPLAYDLHYNQGIQGETNDDVEFGQWVHREILNFKNQDEAIQPFRTALLDYLSTQNDEVVEVEKEILFQLEVGADEKVQIKTIIDIITKNGLAIEMKITGSPGYYQSMLSYQCRLYDLAFMANQLPYKGAYLLFEIDKKKTKSGETERSFKQLHISPNVLTNAAGSESLNMVQKYLELINACEADGVYPPSYNNCATCFYKKECPQYWGF